MTMDQIDAGAFAIYRRFTSHHGFVPVRQLTNPKTKNLLTYPNGRPVMESQDQAARRRWRFVPERVKEEFRSEACDCIAATSQEFSA